MAIITLTMGKSGSGKTTSMRNLNAEKVALINVIGKPLPFKGGNKIAAYTTDDPLKIEEAIKKAANSKDIIIIDDAGYIMTNAFMRGHTNAGQGNGVFMLYNQIGDSFWHLVETARKLPDNKRVYFMMHEDMNDFGNVKPKSIGKMIDEKVCLEGMFTIVLRCMVKDGKHIFTTQSDGMDVAKSPVDMFANTIIDNDLALVDKAICEYYEIKEGKTE